MSIHGQYPRKNQRRTPDGRRINIDSLPAAKVPNLLEFTNFINSLYPTIKFELVDFELNVLDLTFHLMDAFIQTDLYAKPTDSHLYLPYESCHPLQCKNSIPYGVALRIKVAHT